MMFKATSSWRKQQSSTGTSEAVRTVSGNDGERAPTKAEKKRTLLNKAAKVENERLREKCINDRTTPRPSRLNWRSIRSSFHGSGKSIASGESGAPKTKFAIEAMSSTREAKRDNSRHTSTISATNESVKSKEEIFRSAIETIQTCDVLSDGSVVQTDIRSAIKLANRLCVAAQSTEQAYKLVRLDCESQQSDQRVLENSRVAEALREIGSKSVEDMRFLSSAWVSGVPSKVLALFLGSTSKDIVESAYQALEDLGHRSFLLHCVLMAMYLVEYGDLSSTIEQVKMNLPIVWNFLIQLPSLKSVSTTSDVVSFRLFDVFTDAILADGWMTVFDNDKYATELKTPLYQSHRRLYTVAVEEFISNFQKLGNLTTPASSVEHIDAGVRSMSIDPSEDVNGIPETQKKPAFLSQKVIGAFRLGLVAVATFMAAKVGIGLPDSRFQPWDRKLCGRFDKIREEFRSSSVQEMVDLVENIVLFDTKHREANSSHVLMQTVHLVPVLLGLTSAPWSHNDFHAFGLPISNSVNELVPAKLSANGRACLMRALRLNGFLRESLMFGTSDVVSAAGYSPSEQVLIDYEYLQTLLVAKSGMPAHTVPQETNINIGWARTTLDALHRLPAEQIATLPLAVQKEVDHGFIHLVTFGICNIMPLHEVQNLPCNHLAHYLKSVYAVKGSAFEEAAPEYEEIQFDTIDWTSIGVAGMETKKQATFPDPDKATLDAIVDDLEALCKTFPSELDPFAFFHARLAAVLKYRSHLYRRISLRTQPSKEEESEDKTIEDIEKAMEYLSFCMEKRGVTFGVTHRMTMEAAKLRMELEKHRRSAELSPVTRSARMSEVSTVTMTTDSVGQATIIPGSSEGARTASIKLDSPLSRRSSLIGPHMRRVSSSMKSQGSTGDLNLPTPPSKGQSDLLSVQSMKTASGLLGIPMNYPSGVIPSPVKNRSDLIEIDVSSQAHRRLSVMISYPRESALMARNAQTLLQRLEVQVQMNMMGMYHRFQSWIESVLKPCQAVIYMCSSVSDHSDELKDELQEVRKQEKKVYVVVGNENESLPEWLAPMLSGHLHYKEEDVQAALEKLVEELSVDESPAEI